MAVVTRRCTAGVSVPGEVLDVALVEQLRQVPGAGGGTLLDELVPRFLVTFDARLEAVRAAAREGALAEVGRLAHSLSGSLDTFGARGLAADFARLEHLVRSGDTGGRVLATLSALTQDIQQVRSALADLVA